MPLHTRESVREGLLDSIYADHDMSSCLPTDRFPARRSGAEDMFQASATSSCSTATPARTWPRSARPGRSPRSTPDGHRHRQEPDRQGRVPADGRAGAPVRARCWPTCGTHPRQAQPVGCSAIGSSEACMLGGMAAKWRWRAKRQAEGKSTDSPNMVCGPVQVVWHKFARYWDVEMREIPMAPGRYCMDVEQMLERVDENTIMVVPTFGVTYTGVLRARARAVPGARQAAGGERASTSTSTSTGPAAPSSRPSAPRTSSGTSACPG